MLFNKSDWLISSLFFSPAGSNPFAPSGSLLAASASSSQANRTGFRAIMLLWDKVKDSNLKQGRVRQYSCYNVMLCMTLPTDGALRQSSDTRQLEVRESFANIRLRHSQLYSPLLESLSEGFWALCQLYCYNCIHNNQKRKEERVMCQYNSKPDLILWGQCQHRREAWEDREDGVDDDEEGGGVTSSLSGTDTWTYRGGYQGGGCSHSPTYCSATRRPSFLAWQEWGSWRIWRRCDTWRHYSTPQHIKAHFMLHLQCNQLLHGNTHSGQMLDRSF